MARPHSLDTLGRLLTRAARTAPTQAHDERGLLVCEKRCDQCLFSSNRLADTAEILADCERTGNYFLCHKSTITGHAVVCRGFYDHANTRGSNAACQIAHRMNMVAFVNPEDPKT